MHTPSTPSREHKVSFEGDHRAGSEAPSRRSKSRNGSSRTGRGVDEFVAQNLHASGSSAPRAPTTSSTTATTARRQQQAPPSPRRQPVSLEAHPLSFPPLNTDETFLNPGNGGDDVGEFDASRPLTPDVAWEPGEREALGLGVGDQTIREEPRNTGAATRPMGFEIETIPPFELDPHSPLADVDPTFVPIRTIGGKRPGNGNGGGNVAGFETPPRPPIPGQPTIASVLGDAAFVPSSSSQPPGDIGGEFQFGTQGHLRPNANVAAENAARRGKPIPGGSATAIRAPSERYSPYQPHKEHTVLPLRAHPHSTTPGAGPSNHRQAGGRNGRRRQNNQLSERERAERRRRRQLEAAPFRPLDPYAYPIGQKKSPIPPFLEAMRSGVDWVEKRFGLGEEEDLESGHGPGPRPPLNRLSHAAGAGDAAAAEEIPMGRRPAWMRQRRSGATPARSTPTNATGNPNETEAERRARTSHVNSHRIEHEILERETRLAREREERERHRRMSHEEIRDALEHGQPVVPRTSPTRTRPPVHAHPAGVESAPAGQTRGGSKASGSRRPSPDTGSAPQEGTKAAGGLSPPTASPATHPASDPGSPIKHSSPFNLPSISLPKIEFPKPDLGPLLNVGEKDEWSLRDWIRATLIQIYRHLLLRMPSLYFNRVGRVFSEADVSQKEIAILLAQEMRGGPRSLAAWLMNQPNARRLIGGIPGIDDDSEPLLSDGQNSNSPSPNRRPLALHTDDDQSDNEAASFYDEASTLAGHGVEGLYLEFFRIHSP
ncbi:hypothetical protein M408DRAFT_111542 [Serendipita vermifera MAFF 305830]|uniref:Uncharacterized protein n=1 Tax=Serendipita vermifera MAFF 305830 TaxID=933852 RepID=A0A0C3AM08_SERVB|nr:hypothetical protein M408DRAFT_111542 [Serendipita vermifera MAFF 305830]